MVNPLSGEEKEEKEEEERLGLHYDIT